MLHNLSNNISNQTLKKIYTSIEMQALVTLRRTLTESQGRVVSIVTHYGLGGLSFEHCWGRDLLGPTTLALPTQPPVQ